MSLEVIGDPVDQIVTQATKVFFAHVAQIGRKSGAQGYSRLRRSYNRSDRTYRTNKIYSNSTIC